MEAMYYVACMSTSARSALREKREWANPLKRLRSGLLDENPPQPWNAPIEATMFRAGATTP
jgi:hypothetical protein